MSATAEDYAKFTEDADASGPSNSLAVLSQLAQEQLSAEREVARLEELLKKAQDVLKDIAEKRLPEMLDELGVKAFDLSDGTQIKIKETIRVNVSEANRPKAINWLTGLGKSGVVKAEMAFHFGKGEDDRAARVLAAVEQVDPQLAKDANVKKSVAPATMRALVIECLEQGVDVPMDVINVHRQRATEISTN